MSRVAAWAQGLDLQTYHRRLSMCAAADFAACFPSFAAMGDMVLHSVCTRLAESDRLVGRGLLQVWQDLASLALGRGRRRLQVPAAWGMAHSLQTVCPTFRFAWSHMHQRYPVVCPRATWLQLPALALHRLVGYLYECTWDTFPAEEAARLASLVDPAHPGWLPA